MSFICKMGQSDDLETILQLIKERQFFQGYVGMESPGEIAQVITNRYAGERQAMFDNPELFPLIIAVDEDSGQASGYMLVIMGVEESFTDDLHTLIYDYYVRNTGNKNEIMDHFLQQAQAFSEELGLNRILVEIPISQAAEEVFFISRGFYVEMNRILKPVNVHSFDTRLQRRFTVRPARESDSTFIMLLAAKNASFLIPPGSESKSDEIQDSYFQAYSNMNISSDPLMKVFIAEDLEEYRPAGCILIQLDPPETVCAKKHAYLYDISVHPDYWGRYAAQRLVREAENWLASAGIDYLFGDVAQSNPRPLRTAIKSLGFNLYSRRWAKNIT